LLRGGFTALLISYFMRGKRMNKGEKENLVDKAYNALKKMIIMQEIKPGEYLDEKMLMLE